MKTTLSNRILWYDGCNEVTTEDEVINLLLDGVDVSKIICNNNEVKQYNKLCIEDNDEIKLSKYNNNPLCYTWSIPKEYKNFDLYSFVRNIAKEYGQDYIQRVEQEIIEIEKNNLLDSFRAVKYIIDYFNENNIVYGIGRGSSCASLILFFIGLHLVDPILYDISLTEFFHT